MRLSKLQANRKHYRRQLQLIVDAHRIHVVRQVKHDDDLEDLKLITAQELFPCIQEIESLHSELRGLGYYLRVIRRDDFVSRIEDCRDLFLEIVSEYDVKTQEIIAAKGLTKPSEDIIAEERLALERLQEGITTNGLKNAPIDVTIESKPGVLRHIRDLQTRKSQADCPEPYPSAVFRLPSTEHLSPSIESMQTLISEPDQSMEDEAWSPSGISFRQKHHLHEDHVLELANLPPKLPQQSFSTGEGNMSVNGNNTHPDEYVEDNIWPTLKIPWRKRYIIVEEDRDYDMDDELPEVYVPDPFGRWNPSVLGHQEPSEKVASGVNSTGRVNPTETEKVDPTASDELSPSSLNEPDTNGESIVESYSDDPTEFLNHVLEVLREHSIPDFSREMTSSPEED